MLIITRYIQQSFTIGNDVSVRVLGVDKNTGEVRIGIDAPKHIKIHRDNAKVRHEKTPKADHIDSERERQLAEGKKRATLTMGGVESE